MRMNRIIKHASPEKGNFTPSSGIIKRAVVDARMEARRMLAEAEKKAIMMRERAEAEAAITREAARREGEEKSFAEWQDLLLRAREVRLQALATVERDVVRLALKMAEKILGREIERDNAAVVDIIAAALRYASSHPTLTVRVNPADLPVVREHRARLGRETRARFLEIVADPAVAAGGCVIESELGLLEAQLATQLRALERALLEI